MRQPVEAAKGPIMDIVVRDVNMDDLDSLTPLWEEAQRAAGRRRPVPLALSMDRLRRRVELASTGGFRFLAAWRGDRPLGVATVSLTDGGPLVDSPGVHVHVLHVTEQYRHRGVGSALLAAVTGWASEIGSEQVVVDVPPSSRDTMRWYARLGFGPYASRRIATTAALHRRLRPPRTGGQAEHGRRFRMKPPTAS